MLRIRVIDYAVNEINKKTDINIRYELQKTGNKIISILFFIAKENPQALQDQEIIQAKESPIGDLELKLKQY